VTFLSNFFSKTILPAHKTQNVKANKKHKTDTKKEQENTLGMDRIKY